MEIQLPAAAESYLRQLDSALWPLSPGERAAVLLELRGHLTDRWRQGAEPLERALAALGDPAALARAFVEAGAGETYRKVGMRGRTLVAAELPREYSAAPRPLPLTEVVRQVRATFLASRNGLFMVGAVLVTVLTATNFLAWAAKLLPGSSLAVEPVMVVRVGAVLLALAAAYRAALSEEERLWSIDLSTLRFAAAMLGVLAVAAAGVAGMAALAVAVGAGPAVRTAVAIATLVAFSIILLRIHPWIGGLAAGRRDMTLRSMWRGTQGRMINIVKGWLVLVLPLYLLHAALNAAALYAVPLGQAHLALALADAVVAAAMALAAVMLNATVFRWAAGEPIPPPSPFSTEQPNEDLIEEARLRLRRMIEASARERGAA